jgi:hypothetical protein
MRLNLTTVGLAAAVVVLHALHPTFAAASFTPGDAPEIGADAIGGMIAIVAGGLALLRDRIHRG